jgi:hypothetical protein
MAWTDYGLSNDINSFLLNSRLKMNTTINNGSIEGIIKATNERCDMLGVATIYDDLPILHNLSTGPEINIPQERIGVLNTIENKINSIIGSFVNLKENNGNYDNFDDVPMWTKNDILTYLNEPEYSANATKLFGQITRWCFQQYKILNLLVWNKNIRDTDSNGNEKRADDNTWNGAVAAFNAENFQAALNILTGHYADQSGQIYEIVRFANESPLTNNYGHKINVDYYPQFEFYLQNNGIYENNDFPNANANKIYRVKNNIEIIDGATVNMGYGDINDNTMTEPVNQRKSYFSRFGPFSNTTFVEKHNITGGFEFQDNTI